MSIQSLTGSPPSIGVELIHSQSARSDQILQNHQMPPQPTVDTTTVSTAATALPQFNQLQSDSFSRNQTATSINHADSTMAEIGTKIDSMKGQLEIIVKNFPPYPPGSEERLAYLKHFNSLRRQIDELTIPRPVDSSVVAAKVQQLNTGPSGLNIPPLADSVPEATDRQIYHAISSLNTARRTVDASRAGLASSAASLIASTTAG